MATERGGRRTVAIVQRPPALLDLAASFDRAVAAVEEADGADLVVFPETWLTGYPAWVFGMAGWGDPEGRAWYARLLRESPAVGAPDDRDDGLASLRAAAERTRTSIVIGLNERVGGTLFNSLATIGPDGALLNLHRKLVPTHTERIVWAPGDAAGLRAVDTPVGRLGGLVCWEHWMPLARQALHADGEQVHVAAWPDIPELHEIAARGYAREHERACQAFVAQPVAVGGGRRRRRGRHGRRVGRHAQSGHQDRARLPGQPRRAERSLSLVANPRCPPPCTRTSPFAQAARAQVCCCCARASRAR